MHAVVFILGMWLHNSEATPLLDSHVTTVEREQRLEQIAELKSRKWTQSTEDQTQLWTWFWESRLGIQYDDPDVFERVLNIQIGLAAQAPDEILTHLQTSKVLTQTAWKILQRDYNLHPSLLDTQGHQRIQMMLSTMIEQSATPSLSKWLQCWKSDGGSVGIELFRYTLETIHSELKEETLSTTALSEMYDEWGLASKPTPSCPEFQPGQSYLQPIPKEPDPYLSMDTIETPPDESHIDPSTIAVWILLTLGLGLLYKHRQKMFFSVVTPLLFIGCIEAIITPFIQPLIETTPMFQVQNWSVVPWIETDTHYLTQGDYLRAQRINKKKTKNRLVVLGASSAHGSNELMEDTFAGIVTEQTDWEVINLAIGGTTSAGLVTLIPYVEQLRPDALLIYYGHNEVHQLRKLNQFRANALKMLRFKKILWSSRVYTAVYNLLPAEEQPPNEWSLQMAVDNTESMSEQEFISLAEEHFFHNMSLVLSELEGVPTLLVSPPTNYPFAPMADTELYTDDIEALQKRIDAHPEATTIHSAIRRQIRRIAGTYQTTLWDLDFHFHRYSPDGPSANGLFWDELHPSALGHQWIARGVEKWLHDLETKAQNQRTNDVGAP